jgi:hypothetical protein
MQYSRVGAPDMARDANHPLVAAASVVLQRDLSPVQRGMAPTGNGANVEWHPSGMAVESSHSRAYADAQGARVDDLYQPPKRLTYASPSWPRLSRPSPSERAMGFARLTAGTAVAAMTGTSPAMTGKASGLFVNLFGGWYYTGDRR